MRHVLDQRERADQPGEGTEQAGRPATVRPDQGKRKSGGGAEQADGRIRLDADARLPPVGEHRYAERPAQQRQQCTDEYIRGEEHPDVAHDVCAGEEGAGAVSGLTGIPASPGRALWRSGYFTTFGMPADNCRWHAICQWHRLLGPSTPRISSCRAWLQL